MPINTGDLRKGNWVRTEYGIVQIAYVLWNDVYVYLKDGRTNYARVVEGVGIGELSRIDIERDMMVDILKKWIFVHEAQNYFYWHTGKELKLELDV